MIYAEHTGDKIKLVKCISMIPFKKKITKF